jgi:hypothetical protein
MLTRLLFALALCSATTAFGGTTQDVYLKLWAKRGIDLNDPNARLKPKAACVCQDGGAGSNGKLGVYGFLGPGGDALCGLPIFASDGRLAGMSPCANFAYIGN